MAAGEKRQTEGGGSMAGNGGRTRGKGFVQLTRAGRRSTPRSNTRRPSWRNTPFPGSPVTVPLNIRRHPPSFNASPHLRPDIPFLRAGTISFQPPPAQYPYYMGRNSILPTSSGPPKNFIRAGGKTTETGRSTAQQSKRRERVPGEFLLRPGPSPEAPERSRKNTDGQHVAAKRGGRRGTAAQRRKRRDRVQTEFV